MEYVIAAYTDTGIQKETNQDSLCVRRAYVPDIGEIVMAIICDGMGGLKRGEVASAACVTAFGQWFDQRLEQFPMLCGSNFSVIRNQWSELFLQVHQKLLDYSSETKIHLGTTATVLFAYGNRIITANIGDSRIYERKKELVQLTQDQSLVAREIAEGRITEEESRHHPQRNVLLQCLGGIGITATPVYTEGRVPHDALYLLCSDGFVHELSPEEIRNKLNPLALRTKNDMTDALSELVESCKSRGETDNITAILVRTKESEYIPEDKGLSKLKNGLLSMTGKRRGEPSAKAKLLETAEIIHTAEMIL